MTCNTIILLLVLLLPVFSQEIHSTVSNGQSVCPGEIVHFTCTTRGSLVLSWHINDINANILAQFGTFDTIGRVVKHTDNSIFANLTRNSVENGVQVLESLLQVVVGSNYSSLSLICAHENGSIDSITLYVLGRYYKLDLLSILLLLMK